MPRPRINRSISYKPEVTYFKPAGVPMINLKELKLTFDEIEALRLKDLLGLNQSKAAKQMNISQPTFNRLVISARKKVADALVNGKAIRVEGGNFKFTAGRAANCVCSKCGHKEPRLRGPCFKKECPKCGSIMT